MFHYYLSIFISMLVIMDCIGNVPVVLSVTAALPRERVRKVLIREFLLALLLLALFGAAGHWLLKMLSVRMSSLKISGGIILFLIALDLLRKHGNGMTLPPGHEPFLTPIAFPLIAGPGAITNVMFFIHRAKDMKEIALTALMAVAAWLVTCLVLYNGMHVTKIVSKRGRAAISRLMGMLLLAIAVEMMLHGIAEYFDIALPATP